MANCLILKKDKGGGLKIWDLTEITKGSQGNTSSTYTFSADYDLVAILVANQGDANYGPICSSSYSGSGKLLISLSCGNVSKFHLIQNVKSGDTWTHGGRVSSSWYVYSLS